VGVAITRSHRGTSLVPRGLRNTVQARWYPGVNGTENAKPHMPKTRAHSKAAPVAATAALSERELKSVLRAVARAAVDWAWAPKPCVCRNGHVFFVGGCGYAEETGACLECHAALGADADWDLAPNNDRVAPELRAFMVQCHQRARAAAAKPRHNNWRFRGWKDGGFYAE